MYRPPRIVVVPESATARGLGHEARTHWACTWVVDMLASDGRFLVTVLESTYKQQNSQLRGLSGEEKASGVQPASGPVRVAVAGAHRARPGDASLPWPNHCGYRLFIIAPAFNVSYGTTLCRLARDFRRADRTWWSRLSEGLSDDEFFT